MMALERAGVRFFIPKGVHMHGWLEVLPPLPEVIALLSPSVRLGQDDGVHQNVLEYALTSSPVNVKYPSLHRGK